MSVGNSWRYAILIDLAALVEIFLTGLIAGDNVGLTQIANNVPLCRFKRLMAALEHIGQRALADLQPEHLVKHPGQPGKGNRLEGFQIESERMQPGPKRRAIGQGWQRALHTGPAVGAADTQPTMAAHKRRYRRQVDLVVFTDDIGYQMRTQKGQVENQVGVVRRRFFVPRLRFKSYEELNAWLLDRCIAWAKAHPHPEMRDKTIWEMFEAERPNLVPYVGPFDGFHAVPASVSKTCLVRFDNNRYSVSARAVGRPVEIRAYAERVEFWQDGQVVGRHARAFGRGKTVYDPWHYIPVLARKPGALRNGAPFKDWELPSAMKQVRRKLRVVANGDRQMVDILGAVLTDGLPAVEAACAEALGEGVHSADVILNILARRRDPARP